ncbi:hypothetical protein, partial [Methanoregula sp.]|uniref:hypothetical protein n=1 Tax=Methanoregula sp. TaxID=2052170 RepID=UPI003564851B
MDEYMLNSGVYITKALDAIPSELREKVMLRVRNSDLTKGVDVNIDEKANSFSMGNTASDNIENLTAGNAIYNKKNRSIVLNSTDSEDVIKKLFHDDFVAYAKYLEKVGYMPESMVARSIKKAGAYRLLNDDVFYDEKDYSKVNEALFAYYMMFHLSNNAFDDINGSVMNYKNVVDQVKRMGPQNTPKQLINTNVKIGNHFVGSCTTKSKYIPIYDLSVDFNLADDLKGKIDKATDGESLLLPLYRKMFEISSGGRDYSVSGKGSMIKTLSVEYDPIIGKLTEIKHAAKFITEHNFNNSQAYRNMVMDGFKAQDQLLANDEVLQSLPDGHAYKDFSWYERFVDYYDQTGSMDKAVNMLFNDMRDSQYQDNGEALYNALANSVVYGYNPLSTIKTSANAINFYDPRIEKNELPGMPSSFVFDEIDNSKIGVVLFTEQPMDGSKKQAPPQQLEAFMGISKFRLTGDNAAYDTNPGMAINKIRKEIYLESVKIINKQINDVVPQGMERKLGQPLFNAIDWLADDVLDDKRDLSYAMAQFEWFMRDHARRGMANASIQGNYVDMLSSDKITREIPQMRNKMVQSYRQYINQKAIRPGMTGMRVVQATGIFHEFYQLKAGEDILFTRDEALDYLGLESRSIKDFERLEPLILAEFTKRGLKDMRIEGEESRHGEIVMPFIFAKKLGLRDDETMRDIFTLTIDGVDVNVKDMDYDRMIDEVKGQTLDTRFFDSFLIRKALKNIGFGVDQEMLDKVNNGSIDVTQVIKEAERIKNDVRKSLTVFANRVPSNRLASGGWMDIVGFHKDGAEAYIPAGLTLLNDSDFDIDQLAIYFHNLDHEGHMSKDMIDILQSKILDIMEQVYMAKENQSNIFLKSNIDNIQTVADKESTVNKIAPFNANTLYALNETYANNKGGADAIGIMANTLSASAWLQTIGDNDRIVTGKDNPMRNILDRRIIGGKSSLVVMVG